MLSFQLFRIKVYLPGQQNFLREEMVAAGVLRKIVAERPSHALRRDAVWHVGNVEELDKDAAYFRFGKSKRDSIPVLDETTGDFREQEFETAPYTHVVIDFPNEVCAVASEAVLAPDTATIARQMARVFDESAAAAEQNATIEVAELLDPDDFIQHLKTAFAIKKFTLMLSRPNPFDAHEQFQLPFETFVKEARGQTGKAEVKGRSLDSELLQGLARSAGLTGSDATAFVQRRKGARAEKKSLKGSAIVLKREEVTTPAGRMELVVEIRLRLDHMREPDER